MAQLNQSELFCDGVAPLQVFSSHVVAPSDSDRFSPSEDLPRILRDPFDMTCVPAGVALGAICGAVLPRIGVVAGTAIGRLISLWIRANQISESDAAQLRKLMDTSRSTNKMASLASLWVLIYVANRFSNVARELKPEQLPYLKWDESVLGTNMTQFALTICLIDGQQHLIRLALGQTAIIA